MRGGLNYVNYLNIIKRVICLQPYGTRLHLASGWSLDRFRSLVQLRGVERVASQTDNPFYNIPPIIFVIQSQFIFHQFVYILPLCGATAL